MLHVTLSDDWQTYIEAKLKAGHFTSAEELVGEGLRVLKEEDEFLMLHREEVRRKIDEGMESLRRGETIDGEEAFAQLERELNDAHPQGR